MRLPYRVFPPILRLRAACPLPALGGKPVFGRQSTNPQWQNPSLLDPKVNFTWVKGKHSLKFGYEYEHIWMAVNDNNPLYGSFSYSGGYSLCPSTTVGGVKVTVNANCTSINAAVTDNYWAEFLFGTADNYSLANLFVAHLRQTIQSTYAQDDWKILPKLTLNLGLRWEYGSPSRGRQILLSNFDPVSQTVLTITPGYAQTSSVTPVSAGGVYGKTLINPDFADFGPRLGFAYAATPRIVVRGGYGISYVHYTRRAQATFWLLMRPTRCLSRYLSRNRVRAGYRTVDQGYPQGLATTFNPKTDNITYIPKNTKDSYVQDFFVSVQNAAGKEQPAGHRLCRQSWRQAARLPQCQPDQSRRWIQTALHRVAQRHYGRCKPVLVAIPGAPGPL